MNTTSTRIITLIVGAAFALILSSAPAGATPKHDPSGNNGTVKIDGIPFDDHPNNEPHVSCVFQVDFYGFDKGDYFADVQFEGQAPTGGGTLQPDRGSLRVFIGEDAAGGGTDLDASETYDLTTALSTIEPHPKQGWHVKLTTHAPFSRGADVKHKVFWIEPCAASTPETSPEVQPEVQPEVVIPPVQPTVEATAVPTEIASPPAVENVVVTEVLSEQLVRPVPEHFAAVAAEVQAPVATGIKTEVLGVQFDRSPTPLARTGSSMSLFAALGAILMATGLVFTKVGRHSPELEMINIADRLAGF